VLASASSASASCSARRQPICIIGWHVRNLRKHRREFPTACDILAEVAPFELLHLGIYVSAFSLLPMV